MDQNKKLALVCVVPFADKATELGCYSKNQRYNFGTAWGILTKALPHSGLEMSSTIEELLPKVESVLEQHGRTSSAKAASVRAYQARIKQLLADFIKWNGGDFMKWKQEIDKPSANGDAKPQKRRKLSRTRGNSGGAEDDVDSITTHRLIVSSGKECKIMIPSELADEEVDSIWLQLDALKGFVKAQAAVLKGKSSKTPTA
jgi:hypothetical protein